MIKYFSLLVLFLLPSLGFGMGKKSNKKTAAPIEIIKQLREHQSRDGSTVEEIEGLKEQFRVLDAKYKEIKIERIGLKRRLSLVDPAYALDSPKRVKSDNDVLPITPVKAPLLTLCPEPELICSPMKPQKDEGKGLVYMIYVTGQDRASLIEESARINASNLDVGGMAWDNLDKALLEIELKLLNLIDRSLVSRVVYVGQTARDIQTRIGEHVKDLDHKTRQYSSNKVRQINRLLKEHLNVKASYIVADIPRDFIDIVEALVSYIFLVQEFGGSARIANTEAWRHFDTYFKSSLRKKALANKNLDEKLSKIAHELLNSKLGLELDN